MNMIERIDSVEATEARIAGMREAAEIIKTFASSAYNQETSQFVLKGAMEILVHAIKLERKGEKQEGQTMIERVARAIREEIVRQYRDNERQTFIAGVNYYEENISPELIARAAIAVMREPTEEMIKIGNDAWPSYVDCDSESVYRAMIDAALKE